MDRFIDDPQFHAPIPLTFNLDDTDKQENHISDWVITFESIYKSMIFKLLHGLIVESKVQYLQKELTSQDDIKINIKLMDGSDLNTALHFPSK